MKSLFLRFYVSFLVVVLITLGVTIALTTSQVRRTGHSLLTELTSQLVESRADQIGAWLGQRFAELTVLIETDRFQSLAPGDQFAELTRFAERRSGEFETVGLVRPGGMVWVSDGSVIDISDRAYFRRMLDQQLEMVVSAPIRSMSDQQPIVVLMRRVESVMVSGAIPLSGLSDISEEITVRGEKAWIVDENGLVIAHPDRQLLLSRQQSTDSLLRIRMPIPHTDSWFLAVDLPEGVLFREINALTRTLIWIAVVMALFALSLAFYLSRSLVMPIRTLQSRMFMAERGELSVRAPATRKDELGSLEQSFNTMMAQIGELMRELRSKQNELRSKELESRLNQIKPHFLYNTLDSIRWMADERGNDQVSEMITALSRFFRISLSEGSEFIPLREELKQAESYLLLQKMRYEGLFDYEIDADQSIQHRPVLKLVVQPLIENALYHGIKESGSTGRIVVRCRADSEALLIEVRNTGARFDQDVLAAWQRGEYRGYGLGNVNERIKLRYGEGYGIVLPSPSESNGDMTAVLIRHPLVATGEEQSESTHRR